MKGINHDTDQCHKKFSEKGSQTAPPGSEDEAWHFSAASVDGPY
jgi:hypothetical protein